MLKKSVSGRSLEGGGRDTGSRRGHEQTEQTDTSMLEIVRVSTATVMLEN